MSKSAEELFRQPTVRLGVLGGRYGSPEGVTLERCVIRFRKQGKLGPNYIGPFRVLARVGRVAYYLDLPPELSQIHSIFHVSQLRKCLVDDSAVVSLENIQVDDR